MTATPTHAHSAAILAFLQEYLTQHPDAPSYREIAAAVHLPSTDHVSRDIRKLADEGFIVLRPQARRSIELVNAVAVSPTAKPVTRETDAAPVPRHRGHCRRCHVLSDTPLCEDCDSGAPLIQTHLHMGDARYGVNFTTFVSAPSKEDSDRERYRRRNQKTQTRTRSGAPTAKTCDSAAPPKHPNQPRLNAKGEKLCGRCDEPRAVGDAYCARHRREIQLAYYYRHHTKRKAAQNTDTQRQRVRAHYRKKRTANMETVLQ